MAFATTNHERDQMKKVQKQKQALSKEMPSSAVSLHDSQLSKMLRIGEHLEMALDVLNRIVLAADSRASKANAPRALTLAESDAFGAAFMLFEGLTNVLEAEANL